MIIYSVCYLPRHWLLWECGSKVNRETSATTRNEEQVCVLTSKDQETPGLQPSGGRVGLAALLVQGTGGGAVPVGTVVTPHT